MNKINLTLLIVIVAILGSIISIVAIDYMKIVKVSSIPMDVIVTTDEVIGINVDTDAFHFGSLRAGESSARLLKVSHVEQDVIVTMSKKGDMAQWVTTPRPFVVRKGEERNVSLSVQVPPGTPPGEYSGSIVIVLKKA